MNANDYPRVIRLWETHRPYRRFDSYWAHHSFINALRRRQVFEKWCRYGGSIESISVVRDPFREEQLLQPLLVVERRLDPQV